MFFIFTVHRSKSQLLGRRKSFKQTTNCHKKWQSKTIYRKQCLKSNRKSWQFTTENETKQFHQFDPASLNELNADVQYGLSPKKVTQFLHFCYCDFDRLIHHRCWFSNIAPNLSSAIYQKVLANRTLWLVSFTESSECPIIRYAVTLSRWTESQNQCQWTRILLDLCLVGLHSLQSLIGFSHPAKYVSVMMLWWDPILNCHVISRLVFPKWPWFLDFFKLQKVSTVYSQLKLGALLKSSMLLMLCNHCDNFLYWRTLFFPLLEQHLIFTSYASPQGTIPPFYSSDASAPRNYMPFSLSLSRTGLSLSPFSFLDWSPSFHIRLIGCPFVAHHLLHLHMINILGLANHKRFRITPNPTKLICCVLLLRAFHIVFTILPRCFIKTLTFSHLEGLQFNFALFMQSNTWSYSLLCWFIFWIVLITLFT